KESRASSHRSSASLGISGSISDWMSSRPYCRCHVLQTGEIRAKFCPANCPGPRRVRRARSYTRFTLPLAHATFNPAGTTTPSRTNVWSYCNECCLNIPTDHHSHLTVLPMSSCQYFPDYRKEASNAVFSMLNGRPRIKSGAKV